VTWLQFAQAVALTLLFVMGSIFDWVRSFGSQVKSPRLLVIVLELWRELVSCPLCSGFWIGYFSAQTPWETTKLAEVPGFVLWGASVGVIALAVHRGLELVDAKRHELDLQAKILEKALKEMERGS
jgi:hypothetical protein